MVAEHDEVLAARLCEYLSARGMSAMPVETLTSARQMLKRHQFDAVILDLNLGEHGGLALARELAENSRPPSRRRATFGRWTFDASALRLADHSGREVPITGGEMALLRVFLEPPDRVLLRSQIIALTRRGDAEVDDRAIDVLVGRLRRKIEDDPRRPRLVLTVRGEGYRFTADVKWSASE